MAESLGRGTIELVADARAFRATMAEAKKSINDLGKGQADAATRSSRSIDNYIAKLQLQNATIGRSAREAKVFELAVRGASDQQLSAADAALRYRESQERSVKSVSALNVANLGLGVGTIAAARSLITLSDEYTKYTAQLRLATNSQAEYNSGLEAVRTIATASQTSISAVGTLYARIANATRELGIGQKGVADITETVSLSLKASGATAAEGASAMLQLSQAFGAGALRGEEFNAVNEAAPRLMRVLADALAVPVGKLKEMASEGLITSEVLASALPTALGDLRKEAAEVNTIAGAFTVLRNQVVEFIGAQAQASGAVSIISGAIGALARNLDLVAAAAIGLTTTKLAAWLIEAAAGATKKVAALSAVVAASNAERAAVTASTVATTANTAATITNVAAKQGLVTSTLASTAAMGSGGAAAGVAARALGLLGGPIGAITTLLGIGATAWTVWSSRASAATDQVKRNVLQTTPEVLASLDAQIKKMEARRLLAMTGPGGAQVAQQGGPEAEQAGELLREMRRIQDEAAKSGQGVTEQQASQLAALGKQYGEVTERIQRLKAVTDDVQRAGQERGVSRWLKEYATDAEKLNAELEKARKELGPALTPELERRIREKFAPKTPKPKVDTTQDRVDDEQLQLDLARIRRAGDAEIAEFERSQRIMEAMRGAGLVQDREYYASRRAFIELNTAAQERALDAEIARLRQETFSGKNATAERIENDRKIADAQSKLAKVRADAVAELEVNSIQERAANERIRQSYLDAAAAADAYIDSIRRRNELEIAGIGRGALFRERSAGEAEAGDRFRERRQQLESELRRGEITRDVFDTYLATAAAAYEQEIGLYRDRNARIDALQLDWRNGAREAFANYADDVRNVAKTFEDVFGSAIRRTEDDLTKFLDTGKLDVKSFADAIRSDLNRAFVRERITGPIAEAMKSGDFLPGLGGIAGNILGAITGVPKQAPAPVEARNVGGILAGTATGAVDGAAFTASVTAAGTTFSAATVTAGTSLSATLAAAGASLAATIAAAGAQFAASVAASSGGGAGGLADIASLALDSLATGTPFVPRTGLYQLHRGERVVPAAENAAGGGRTISLNVSVAVPQGADRRTSAHMGIEFARAAQRELARGTA